MAREQLELKDCALSDLGRMDYGFARGRLPQSQHPLLIVRLSGDSDNASSEMRLFDYAAAIIMAGLEAWHPTAIVLDLRGFSYSWGDQMANVLGAPQHWYQAVYPLQAAFGGENIPKDFPVTVITSDTNREGLLSLVSDYLHEDPSLLLFESLEDAVQALDDRMKDVPLV